MAVDWQIIENRELREKLYWRTLDPGLDLYVLPKAGYQKKYAAFATHFGSIDSKFQVNGSEEIVTVPDGVAHFLEHKLFEDEEGDVTSRFAALGASSNAYTTFTHTNYLFSCTGHFRENLELLLNFVQEPYFTAASVQKEQGIIGQEIRMYEDHPQWRVFFNLLAALYHEHPVRIDIAGTVESIARITPDVLYQCYRTFYHPSNMAVFVVGDLDPDAVSDQVAENLARHKHGPLGSIRRFFPDEPPEIARQRVTQELVVSEPLFNLGFKDPRAASLEGRELLRRETAMELLLEIIFGESEPLYNELYEDGLIDDNFDYGYTAEKTYGYTLISGETRDPELLYRRIMDGLEKFRKDGFTEEQFERHRRNQLGSFMQRFNSLEFIANNYLAYRFRGTDLFAYPAVLQEVKGEDLMELMAENLDPQRHAVSLILPREESGDGS